MSQEVTQRTADFVVSALECISEKDIAIQKQASIIRSYQEEILRLNQEVESKKQASTPVSLDEDSLERVSFLSKELGLCEETSISKIASRINESQEFTFNLLKKATSLFGGAFEKNASFEERGFSVSSKDFSFFEEDKNKDHEGIKSFNKYRDSLEKIANKNLNKF